MERDKFFGIIFGPFFALYPLSPTRPNNPENQKFERASGDVIILNLCNKKHDQMMYTYSDMECDRHKFLSI